MTVAVETQTKPQSSVWKVQPLVNLGLHLFAGGEVSAVFRRHLRDEFGKTW